MLTDERLAEIEARLEKATPGPWIDREPNKNNFAYEDIGRVIEACESRAGADEWEVALFVCGDDDDPPDEVDRLFNSITEANVAFIREAITDIPALIAALREARKMLGEWEMEYGECPRCNAWLADGGCHSGDCDLAAALGKTNEAPRGH